MQQTHGRSYEEKKNIKINKKCRRRRRARSHSRFRKRKTYLKTENDKKQQDVSDRG